MRNHLSLRSGNPVLTKETFNAISSSSSQMTIEGTVNKTALSLFLLVGTGYLTFNPISPAIIFTCGIGGFILAIVTGFFIASYSLVDGYGARVTQNPVGFYSVTTVLNGLIFYVFARWKEKEILKRIILSGKMYFFIGGTASYVAYGIVVWACLYLPIAVVSSLRETSILFAVLLGLFFLKEKINLTKSLLILGLFFGVIILRLN